MQEEQRQRVKRGTAREPDGQQWHGSGSPETLLLEMERAADIAKALFDDDIVGGPAVPVDDGPVGARSH